MSHLYGHLDLECSASENGQSYISRQSYQVPFHISKPYWDGNALMIQVINPTAGLLAGDRLRSKIQVNSGAKLLITSPSANRVHKMAKGSAKINQSFHVAPHGWLEYFSAPLIPQKDSTFSQQTNIQLAHRSEMFFVEILYPGRVAHGEVFQFNEVNWECNIRLADRLLVRERFILTPKNNSIISLTTPFMPGYFASCYLISHQIDPHDPCWKKIRNLNGKKILLGVSRLIEGGWSIKIISADSISLKNTLTNIRKIFSEILSPLKCQFRDLR